MVGAVTSAIRDAEMEALHAADSGSFHFDPPQLEEPPEDVAPEAEGGATLAHMPIEGRAALARSSADVRLLTNENDLYFC